ncbi:MAG: GH116 family glycosyl hydrolase [Candidatus Brocadiia bacterium]
MSDTKERIPYGKDELFSVGPREPYSGEALQEIAFPLGGIGTGCVSLGGRGQLRDWEIFNRPNQGFRPRHTFPVLRAQAEGAEPVTKVLESPPQPPYSSTHGYDGGTGAGLPHMDSNTFRGWYPIARIQFQDAEMPVTVALEAFNPFIPLNEFDSSLPGAVLIYQLENPTDRHVEVLLVWRLQNVVGYKGTGGLNRRDLGGNINVFRTREGLSGFLLGSEKHPEDDPRFGTLALTTPWSDVTYAGSADGRSMWNQIAEDGTLDDTDLREPTEDGRTATCALGLKARLEPGERVEMPIFLTWCFPNYVFGEHQWGEPVEKDQPHWRNYYAQQFEDAWAAAEYFHENLDRLRAETQTYHDALYDSTLPTPVLDAAGSQTSTLKTPTCMRLEDGTFYGFEGCSSTVGCCPGSCTHVWNYQQALPFLFPALERSMRTADYEYNLREEDGRMCFRIGLPLGTSHWEFHAAADGQLGGIIKTYRDWLICGDDDWLRRVWPRVKKSLSYAWEQWDIDRDGVPEGIQHNTYDIEFQGPNPLIGAFYLGALRAAEEMARHLGEDEQAAEYRELFDKGSAKMDEMLFNGEYYVQKYDPQKAKTQQFGPGCLSDQMLGQWIAAICDLGHVLKPDHVRSALRSIFRYNWRPSLEEHVSFQRIYALGDEAGLLMLSWPRGGRPETATRYCDEVWTGIEYQVASHLIMEGYVEEGLAIVKGVRDRHDGRRRNPWDEPECGSHYARAMSSWGLVLALSGFFCDASRGLLRFAPRVQQDDFRCFWSDEAAWGTFAQRIEDEAVQLRLEVLGGTKELEVLQFDLPGRPRTPRAETEEGEVKCELTREGEYTEIRFGDAATIGEGQVLTVTLRI